jgi:hypothetical protein
MTTYKAFTCPPENCPDENALIHKHTEFGVKKTFSKKWGKLIEKGKNCKLSFSADTKLNGKLMVKVIYMADIKPYVYMMPNKSNHGITENKMLYPHRKHSNSLYEVPSDWSIHFSYHGDQDDGSIEVETWVEAYQNYDVSMINSMQPS